MKILVYNFLALMCLLASTHAHLTMLYPCPFNSPNGKDCPPLPPGAQYDYELNSPISSVTQNTFTQICRKSNPWTEPAAKWKAGETVTFEFTPNGAAHSGGHLEFAVSYDKGKQWVVLKQVLRYAFVGSKPASPTNTMTVTSYDVDLPSDLPSGDNVYIAFFWVNASGNREFYNACSIVSISGSTSTSFTGKAVTYANMPGEPTIPEFNGDYESGIDLYTTKAKTITVTADGKTTNSNKDTNIGSDNSANGKNNNDSSSSSDSENINADDGKCEEDLTEDLLNDSSAKPTDENTDENTDELDGDKCDDETDEPTDDFDDDKCDDETDEPTDEFDDDKCDDETDDSSSESTSDSSSNSLSESSSSDSSSNSSSASSSDSFSNSSSESSSESSSSNSLSDSSSSESLSGPSSDPSEMGDLDSASSESSDSSSSSESSSADFAYPVMPTNEPDLMCDVLSNSPVENFYMQNIYASYGYLTETSVADSLTEDSLTEDSLTEDSSSEEPSSVDVAIDLLDDESVSSSTESPEPTESQEPTESPEPTSSTDNSSYNKFEYSQSGDENNNVVNISIN